MPIPHKYKTGETVLFDGMSSSDEERTRQWRLQEEHQQQTGKLSIVVASWKEIIKYSNFPDVNNDSYDESSSEKIYYCLLSIETNYNRLWWMYEPRLELYCSNTERGMNKLKQVITQPFLSRYWSISAFNIQKFVQDYIGT